MTILTHVAAAIAGLVLGAVYMRYATAASRDVLRGKLAAQDELIALWWKRLVANEERIKRLIGRIALLEAVPGPCSAQGGCCCPPDTDEDVREGYAGWA